ncbi:hypothetical protein OK016_28995 [Vibrio chagasii]|nr:hypothetical protein [Vibrio chagasii]
MVNFQMLTSAWFTGRNTHWQVLNGSIDYLIHFEGYPLPQEIQPHSRRIELCLVAKLTGAEQKLEWASIHHLPLAR